MSRIILGLRRDQRRQPMTSCASLSICLTVALSSASAQQTFDPARGIVLRGTVVTMDPAGTILDKGNILVRNGKIVAVWAGSKAPDGTPINNAIEADLGPNGLI